MRSRTRAEDDAPFATITEAARRTGLSQFYLRSRCKAGEIPVLMSGGTYMILMPELMAQLREEAVHNASS